ncbi:MAG: hypothetical protein HY930_03390, partial [Euryarchaeota archaeon]|nr:hypothetical protein [Euryarchaeota archaeon]
MKAATAILAALLVVVSTFASVAAQANVTKVEIEVEFQDNIAKVEVKADGVKTEFTINTTNRELIIEEIVARTGYTIEQVKNAIEFEAEFKKKVKDAQFPVKKRTAIFQLKRHLLGMDEVIKFAKEHNVSTAKLEELRNNFASVIEKMEQAVASEEKDPLGRYVSEAVKIAKDFREEGRKLLGNKADEARERVK